MTYEDVLSLTDLTEQTLYDPHLGYLLERYMKSLEQYQSFCKSANLDTARVALDDAVNDLYRLLLVLDPRFKHGDAVVLNSMYVGEYMDGWRF